MKHISVHILVSGNVSLVLGGIAWPGGVMWPLDTPLVHPARNFCCEGVYVIVSVYLSVCVSVCVLLDYLPNACTDHHQIWWVG